MVLKGPSGLVCARRCLESGLECIILEQSDHVGGLWWYEDKPNSKSVFQHMVSNVKAADLTIEGFPMEPTKTEYPTHTEYCDYLQSFAAKSNILDSIRFNSCVEKVSLNVLKRWTIQFTDTALNVPMVIEADYVAVCNGHEREGKVYGEDVIPGISSFAGKQMHSSAYRNATVASQLNVLVVGMGCSGIEIMNQISPYAQNVVGCSMRMEGPSKTPRSVRGKPKDKIDSGGSSMSAMKPKIRKMSKNEVTFDDKSTMKPDLIIWCTGFVYHIPFIPEDIVAVRQGRLELFQHMFPNNVENDSMCFIGLPNVHGSSVTQVADIQSKLFVGLCVGKCKLPPRKDRAVWLTAKRKIWTNNMFRPLQVDVQLYKEELSSVLGMNKSIVVQSSTFGSEEDVDEAEEEEDDGEEGKAASAEDSIEEEEEEEIAVPPSASAPSKSVERKEVSLEDKRKALQSLSSKNLDMSKMGLGKSSNLSSSLSNIPSANTTTASNTSVATLTPPLEAKKGRASTEILKTRSSTERPARVSTAERPRTATEKPASSGHGSPSGSHIGNSSNSSGSTTSLFSKVTPAKEKFSTSFVGSIFKQKGTPYPADALKKRLQMYQSLLYPHMISVPVSGACGVQGKRETMEDAHVLIDKIPGVPEHIPSGLWAVYDGHGGIEVSKMAEQMFHVKFQKMLINALLLEGKAVNDIDVEKMLRRCFKETDKAINEKLKETDNQSVGSTVAVCVLLGHRLFVANAGDSEVVLATAKMGESVAQGMEMSYKHKPRDEREKLRIETLGGMVFQGRVYGTLSVTRGFGDTAFKPPCNPQFIVCPDPDVKCINVTPEHRYVILACDGVWDKVTHEEAAEFIHGLRQNGLSVQECAEWLVREAEDRISRDNVTAVVVDLQWSVDANLQNPKQCSECQNLTFSSQYCTRCGLPFVDNVDHSTVRQAPSVRGKRAVAFKQAKKKKSGVDHSEESEEISIGGPTNVVHTVSAHSESEAKRLISTLKK